MGPKLLVSDLSTADQPVLRWRLVVRGNTAVEFGVVPLSMVVSTCLSVLLRAGCAYLLTQMLAVSAAGP
jgi:hypothetical protein